MILAFIIGCLAGILTGLVPGIHTNTIAVLLLGSETLFLNYFSPLDVCVLLISMVMVHSFMDYIPSIFLGAPDPATALSVLPGHEFLLNGEGYYALGLTVFGGFGTLLIGLFFLPIMIIFLKQIYFAIKIFLGIILVVFSILFILKERKIKKIFWAIFVFLISGALGFIALQSGINQPLFPLFSGLFGMSTLLLSFFTNPVLCSQKLNFKIIFSPKKIISCLKASISALITSVLPGIGAAQAAVIAQGFTKFKNKEEYLLILGGINSVSVLFTLTTFFIIGKARTGVIYVMREFLQLTIREYIILIVVGLCAAGIGGILTLLIGKKIINYLKRISYRKISLMILLFLSILIFYFSGPLGLFIALIGMGIGLIAPITGIKRIHAMGCLILPVILFFM